ncbi:MAG: hypothetical protein KJ737_26335 [Proteobacteria bacterium]|nr:hypothetical protein [Pseudomonadota bacterium]
MNNEIKRFAGCDLGKASASFVILGIDERGNSTVESTDYEIHEGKPFDVFFNWYKRKRVWECQGLGATGVYVEDFISPALVFPGEGCQEAVLENDSSFPETLNLINIGACGYSALTREPVKQTPNVSSDATKHSFNKKFQTWFVENEKCSSGTGENVQKIAGRFGIGIDEADTLAMQAYNQIPITARCSVFAKSEMTHYANQGKDKRELFAGYFNSLARNSSGLLKLNRVKGPVYLIGGCARICSFVNALEEQLEEKIIIPENFLGFEALGAALLASQDKSGAAKSVLPENPSELVKKHQAKFTALKPAYQWRDNVAILDAPSVRHNWEKVPTILGLDLGSTGAKAVLTDINTKAAVFDVYDTTRGNPVDAARRLVDAILRKGNPDIRAIGVTGSGREAVGILLRAVFPDACDRMIILNEIVAHATSAMHLDSDKGDDLTVIEIGGQDAKYIRLSGGRIVESDMNKACSAGTGSFLAEQAACYDILDMDEFIGMASAADSPPDLGMICTVFVADSGAEALKEGFSLGDVFAGFQYSIIHNYLNRVMGQRTFGRKIFFQGKPATNPSLAWTLAAVTEREITVPPNPGAMGAWGIGMCAIDSLKKIPSQQIHIGKILEADVVGRSEFPCADKDCQTLCPIERTTIMVGEAAHKILSGGACSKYEVLSQTFPKLSKDAPDPFMERERLLSSYDGDWKGKRIIGIPEVGPVQGHLPWLVTYIGELGFQPKILKSNPKALAKGENLCNSYDSCGPTKICHAICDADVPVLFFPKIMNIYDRMGHGGESCVTGQSMPEMIEQSIKARKMSTIMIRPAISFKNGLLHESGERSLARALGVDPEKNRCAIKKAAAAQLDYETHLIQIGRKAIDYAEAGNIPVVVLCGARHVIHDPAMNGTIPKIIRQNGAMAIPMDCYPISDRTPPMKKIYWGEAKRYLRVAYSARNTGNTFPVMLSSFGCGPASFTEHVFQNILKGYPHTILESDGHGGTAGFVTRIQAFLQSVHQYRSEGQGTQALPDDGNILYAVDHVGDRATLRTDVHYIIFSNNVNVGELVAAVFRSNGYDAVPAPPFSHENYNLGKKDCSGKECYAYPNMWGSFRSYLEANPPKGLTQIVTVTSTMCRVGLFAVKDQMGLGYLGLSDKVGVAGFKVEGRLKFRGKLWVGIVALDLLRQLYLYHIAIEREPGASLTIYNKYAEKVLRLMEEPFTKGFVKTFEKLVNDWGRLQKIIEQAALDYTAIKASKNGSKPLPVVFASGDRFVRGNDFINNNLFLKLAEKGIHIVMEPVSYFFEYLARYHPHIFYHDREKAGKPELMFMVQTRNRLYSLVKKYHSWLPVNDVVEVTNRSKEFMDRSTNGPIPYAIGSVMHNWETGHYDGVVLTSCWGCDSGLVEESILKHNKDIPWYFFYADGTHIDERKLAAYAFRLQRNVARNSSIHAS